MKKTFCFVLASVVLICNCDDGEKIFIFHPCETHDDCLLSDNIICTIDLCHEDGFCMNFADDNRCSDFYYCDVGWGCRPRAEQLPSECLTTSDCDDHVMCTVDLCSGGVCYNWPNDFRCPNYDYCDINEGCSYSALRDLDRDGVPDFMDNCV